MEKFGSCFAHASPLAHTLLSSPHDHFPLFHATIDLVVSTDAQNAAAATAEVAEFAQVAAAMAEQAHGSSSRAMLLSGSLQNLV